MDNKNIYDEKYDRKDYYWGKVPSKSCCRILELMPPDKAVTLLDTGCGEGRNAVFFARNGYTVSAFDPSLKGVEQTIKMASEAGVTIDVFQADVKEYRLDRKYDILFSTGVLHFIPPDLRSEVFKNYKANTSKNGLNVFTVFVQKPFIEKAPDPDPGPINTGPGSFLPITVIGRWNTAAKRYLTVYQAALPISMP